MLRNIRLIYLHNVLTDFALHWPFQVIYFADITGSYVTAMSIIALETFSAAVFDLPTGVFSDRLGRRLTMACGSMAQALGIGLYAYADFVTLHSLGILYLGAIFLGLGKCLFTGTDNALLFESLQAENLQGEYHHYRGRSGSMYQVGLCLSALLSTWLSHFGLRVVFICAVIPQILAAGVSLLFIEPKKHIAAPRHGWVIFKQACIKTWQNPHLLGLVTARALNYGIGETMFKFQSAYINLLWPLWAVGLSRVGTHILSFTGFQLAGRMIEKIGEPVLFVARDIYWLLIDIAAVIFNNFISPLIIMSGAVFFGPGEVASDHLMQKEFTDEERATMGSISSFATSLVFTLASLGVGMVADGMGPRFAYLLGALCQALSLPLNLWLFRERLGFKAAA